MEEYSPDAPKAKRDSILTAKEQLRKEEWFVEHDFELKYQKVF